MDKIRNQPQNLFRKIRALNACILELECLRRSYRPIFEEDPAIARLLSGLHIERERVFNNIRKLPDYNERMDEFWEED